jgi:diguanylate cyclase (GGDEF)-like protein
VHQKTAEADRGTKAFKPSSLDDVEAWVRQHLDAPAAQKAILIQAISDLLDKHRALWQDSKLEAVQALAAGFSGRLAQLQHELEEKDATARSLSRYFEEVVAGLTEKAHRDPKTRLMNFDWFMQRFESFLAVEQRVRWCGIGLVDITSFKWFNDNLGHAAGDRIIERVASLLADQLRSRDLLATQDIGPNDLHARFGGDEFAFLIRDLPGPLDAHRIASRFKRYVEDHDWRSVDARLADHPVRVDVGVVALRLGPIDERRGVARILAAELLERADQLMYGSKTDQAGRVFLSVAGIEQGGLVELTDKDAEEPATATQLPGHAVPQDAPK